MDSYIERQNELRENGFEFIWVTDGIGWKDQKNQIEKGFERVDYLLNLHFVRGVIGGNIMENINFKKEITTVWSFPDRGKWKTHNGNYRGNFAPQIPRNLILRYSQEEM